MAGYNSYNSQYQNGLNTVPLTYGYQYPQMQVQPQPQPQQEEEGIIWVQGEAGAKSSFVKPGRSKLMMDSEQPVFYIKTADMSGMPLPLRIFDFVERTSNQNISPVSNSKSQKKEPEYVKKDELESLVGEIIKKRTRNNSGGNKNE